MDHLTKNVVININHQVLMPREVCTYYVYLTKIYLVVINIDQQTLTLILDEENPGS